MSKQEKQVFFEFIKAINDHDIDKIYSLMSDDHEFVDAHGNEVTGKEKMRTGWVGYFQLFPDYKIEITDLFADGETLAGFGFAGGTYKNRKTPDSKAYWHLPAAWKAVVSKDKIKFWQVYADTKIPFEIIEREK